MQQPSAPTEDGKRPLVARGRLSRTNSMDSNDSNISHSSARESNPATLVYGQVRLQNCTRYPDVSTTALMCRSKRHFFAYPYTHREKENLTLDPSIPLTFCM